MAKDHFAGPANQTPRSGKGKLVNLPSDAEVIGRSLAEPRPSGSSTIATPPPCSASWAARRVGAEVAEGLVGELFRIAFERRKTFDASRVSALPWMFEVPEAFRSLRSRDFRAFLGVQTISQIGTYMLSVAEAWLVVPRQTVSG